MSIQYLKHADINLEKWDTTIDSAANGLPYAYSWYLTAIADQNWGALVKGDYEAVMPLPWNTKIFGIPQLYQPVLSQQLGVFGQDIDESLVHSFLQKIPLHFKYILLNLNESNAVNKETLTGLSVRMRRNLLLDLSPSAEQLEANYSKSLRKSVRKARKNLVVHSSKDVNKLVDFYRTSLEPVVKLGGENYTRIKRLIELVLQQDKGRIYEVCDGQKNLLAIGLFLFSHQRIINVFGASSERGKQHYAMHCLIDALIQEQAQSQQVFDFEGSDIDRIATFFKSFGSQEVYYPQIGQNRLPIWADWIKHRRWRFFFGK